MMSMAQIQRTEACPFVILSDMTFGARLAEACALVPGMTQDDIGDLLDAHQTTVNKWIKQGVNPRGLVKTANKASRKLRDKGVVVSAHWLLTGEGVGPIQKDRFVRDNTDAEVNQPETSMNESGDVEEVSPMSPVERMAFIDLLDGMLPDQRASWYERMAGRGRKKIKGREAAQVDPLSGRVSSG